MIFFRLLLEHEANANLKDNSGWAPIHLSAAAGQHALATTLVAHGAEANQRCGGQGEGGATAMHIAAAKGHLEVVKVRGNLEL